MAENLDLMIAKKWDIIGITSESEKPKLTKVKKQNKEN